MIHVHQKECETTQMLAMELMNEHPNDDVLASCERQTKGAGQRGKPWTSCAQCMALSFSAWPADIVSLTSLEMAVLAKDFLARKFETRIVFKWPNDLFTIDGKKCGGILIQNCGDRLVVGVGLNLFGKTPKELPQMGFISSKELSIDVKQISRDFYQHVINNRMPSRYIASSWVRSCAHLNQQVKMIENSRTIIGDFVGVGEQGQALLSTEKGIEEFFSASLLMKPSKNP